MNVNPQEPPASSAASDEEPKSFRELLTTEEELTECEFVRLERLVRSNLGLDKKRSNNRSLRRIRGRKALTLPKTS